MNWSAFDLLGIRYQDGGSSVERGRGGSGGYTPYTGWANKDDAGGSSIAAHNNQTRQQQMADKTRDAYRHDVHDEVFRDPEMKDRSRDEKRAEVERRMNEYDADPKKQREAQEQYRPDLSSLEQAGLERSRQASGVDPDKKEAAKEAVRAEIKSQTRRDQNNDNFSGGAKGFGDDKFIADRKNSEPEAAATGRIQAGQSIDDESGKPGTEYLSRSEIEQLIDDKIADRVWYGSIS